MSRVLFWYIMRDLLRIFLITSGVLAGIMSFGGLLVQMMRVGISGWQVGQMLLYLMPAMQTYCLSFSALFATTMVYGRLSADNELTACRATGISYLTLAVPAMVMGLVLAISSLWLLSYVVPHYVLKSEKVVFNSLAELIQNSIQRSHQFKVPGTGLVIYADAADVLASPADAPDDEIMVLHNPMVCSFKEEEKGKPPAPAVFWVARTAQARLRQTADHVEFWVHFENGMKFPRESGNEAVDLGTLDMGPVSFPSPVPEKTKFMNIRQLDELYRDPTRSRDIRTLYNQITAAEQEQDFLQGVADSLKDPRRLYYRFDGAEGDSYLLSLDPGPWRPRPAASKLRLVSSGERPAIHLMRMDREQDAGEATLRLTGPQGERLEVVLDDVDSGGPGGADARRYTLPLPARAGTSPESALAELFEQLSGDKKSARFDSTNGETYVLSMDRSAWLEGGARELTIHSRAGREVHLQHTSALHAHELELVAQANLETRQMGLEFDLTDVTVGGSGQRNRAEPFAVPMSKRAMEIEQRGADYYLHTGDKAKSRPTGPVARLIEMRDKLLADIEAEIHCRVSFAISALILVVVGSALGMMFKTANYLSAFAVSAMPAMLCIAMAVTGQHVVEGNPLALKLGLGLIWAGDALVFALGVGLLGWLQRQ